MRIVNLRVRIDQMPDEPMKTSLERHFSNHYVSSMLAESQMEELLGIQNTCWTVDSIDLDLEPEGEDED